MMKLLRSVTVVMLLFLFSCGGEISRNGDLDQNDRYADSVNQSFAEQKAKLALQNEPGTQANDFTYQTPGGERRRLYQLLATQTLLFFYNPECPACKQMKVALLASELIQERVADGKLVVLAMYIDADTALWKKHLPEQPEGWLQGRDEGEFLFKNGVYDLHAIPTLYLLDKDKKVLLKDVMGVFEVEDVLKN